MRSLPFETDDLNGGFMKLEGILRVEGSKLHFEFQKKDAVLEAYQSEINQVVIDLYELESSEFKKGFFSNKLILNAPRAAVFSEIPGGQLTVRKLKVKKKYRDLAAKISSNINLKLSEQRLKEMED
ncbi:hypothetical protein AB2B38_013130 [Balneola sp. MJW-20]|uniref:hypothetical protein n=1 Tax=Gracilimonas aurantiaca TaxID=3234185 RepID=UPI0034651C84